MGWKTRDLVHISVAQSPYVSMSIKSFISSPPTKFVPRMTEGNISFSSWRRERGLLDIEYE